MTRQNAGAFGPFRGRGGLGDGNTIQFADFVGLSDAQWV
jgi:hypothetical protein